MSSHWLKNFYFLLGFLFAGNTLGYGGQPPLSLKGLSQLYKMVSFETQVAFLRQQNPAVPVKIITETVRQFRSGTLFPVTSLPQFAVGTPPTAFTTVPLQHFNLQPASTVGQLAKQLQPPVQNPGKYGPLEPSMRLLKQYLPDWQRRLSAIYTPEQVDFIHMALAISDYSLMTRTLEGGFSLRGDEWNFTDRFINTLQTIAPHHFSAAQRKELVSKNLAPGFSLKSLFRLRSLQNFVTLYDRLPSNFGTTHTPEYQLATSIFHTVQREDLSPDEASLEARIKNLYQTYEQPWGERSPASLLKAVQEFVDVNGSLPRYAIANKTADQYTPEERAETSLRRAVYNTLRNAPSSAFEEDAALSELQQFMSQKTTPEQLLEQLQMFVEENGRMPRMNIPGSSPDSYTSEEQFETHLRHALENTLQRKAHLIDTDPALQQLKQFKEEQQKKGGLSLETLVEQAQSFIARNGVFPRALIPGKKPAQYTEKEQEETRLYRKIYEAIHSQNEEESPEQLARLRYLKTRYNAKAVEFYQVAQETHDQLLTYLAEQKEFPPIQSSLYRRVYTHLSHPTYNELTPDFSSPVFRLSQLAQRGRAAQRGEMPFNFISPAVERRAAQARTDYYGPVPWTETHQLLTEASNKNKVDYPLEFESWYLKNEGAIVANTETNQAFEALRKSARNGTVDDETYRILDKLYHLNLSSQPDGSFMGIAYRGENPSLPLAKHFHAVKKIHHLSKDEVPDAFIVEKTLPHIYLAKTEDNITKIFLNKGVTAQELNKLVRTLTPAGYTVRMSPHEFGLQNDLPTRQTLAGYLHIHIEKIQPTGEGEPDISYIIDINAHRLLDEKSPQQIMKIYRDLFWEYMDDYMKNFVLP